eukprot:1470883-Amphidinium_carterae.1
MRLSSLCARDGKAEQLIAYRKEQSEIMPAYLSQCAHAPLVTFLLKTSSLHILHAWGASSSASSPGQATMRPGALHKPPAGQDISLCWQLGVSWRRSRYGGLKSSICLGVAAGQRKRTLQRQIVRLKRALVTITLFAIEMNLAQNVENRLPTTSGKKRRHQDLR